MPDDNTKPTPTTPESAFTDSGEAQDIKSKVAHALADSQNVLVALSSDPSVDEMAAAIGLSLYLDRLGKRATAIYSGATPNALEFLKPEETFEPSPDALQDFVVALNKEKADHVRCKVDGDYVKMYITPYRTRVSEEDLEFSYGDYNVDLVLALDVANGIDLDSALREHGRIMHDASIINVTTGNPGKFGEIEWSDKTASSISEMFADLIFNMNTKGKLSPEEATAFLTGIVAATDRFSTAATTSETMKIASKLMEAGANQQLISQNITDDIENEMFNVSAIMRADSKKDDLSDVSIDHTGDEALPKKGEGVSDEQKKDEKPLLGDAQKKDKEEPDSMSQENSLLADLQRAAASLAQAGDETVPVPGSEPIKIDDAGSPDELLRSGDAFATMDKPQEVSTFGDGRSSNEMHKIENPASMNAPQVASAPEINGIPNINYAPSMNSDTASFTESGITPSMDSGILPPPPAPPVNENMFTPTEDIMNASAPVSDSSFSGAQFGALPEAKPEFSAEPLPGMQPEAQTGMQSEVQSGMQPEAQPGIQPESQPGLPLEAPIPSLPNGQPNSQVQTFDSQNNDPSAFKIPGM